MLYSFSVWGRDTFLVVSLAKTTRSVGCFLTSLIKQIFILTSGFQVCADKHNEIELFWTYLLGYSRSGVMGPKSPSVNDLSGQQGNDLGVAYLKTVIKLSVDSFAGAKLTEKLHLEPNPWQDHTDREVITAGATAVTDWASQWTVSCSWDSREWTHA